MFGWKSCHGGRLHRNRLHLNNVVSKMPSYKEIPLESPIEEKIAWAENCYFQIRDQLLGDKRIVDLLKKLKEAISASQRERVEAGVVSECKDCEEKDGGSCCGAGMENRYSGIILLINLLLGVKIPKNRQDPQSCFFLGLNGCQLLARQVICANYLCKKITERIVPQKIAALQEKEGVELELLFILNERTKKMIK